MKKIVFVFIFILLSTNILYAASPSPSPSGTPIPGFCPGICAGTKCVSEIGGEEIPGYNCVTPSSTPSVSVPPGPCGNGEKCPTAFGDITTDPTGFIKSLFGIILSLSGGVAIILIIISGYRLMSSQGNPEKVQAAREQLTSAIVGLLFIIFSVTILQIIGVDILHIPGLTR